MKRLASSLFLLILTACSSTPHIPRLTSASIEAPLLERLKGPRAGAHQGDVYSLRFNTLFAFEKARKEGADIIELDLRVSKDGVPVVYHDKNLSRWTSCGRDVRDLTLSDLKACRFYGHEEVIPTFEEVLVWSKGSVVINAEFKDDASVVPAVALVRAHRAYEWVYFQVRNFEQYREIRAQDKEIALSLDPRTPEELDRVLSLSDPRIVVIELHESIRTPATIARIRAHGKRVSENSWHFDNFQEFFGASCASVFALGIDIAITNRASACVGQKEMRKN